MGASGVPFRPAGVPFTPFMAVANLFKVPETKLSKSKMKTMIKHFQRSPLFVQFANSVRNEQ